VSIQKKLDQPLMLQLLQLVGSPELAKLRWQRRLQMRYLIAITF
jgi:hypothetical protein